MTNNKVLYLENIDGIDLFGCIKIKNNYSMSWDYNLIRKYT